MLVYEIIYYYIMDYIVTSYSQCVSRRPAEAPYGGATWWPKYASTYRCIHTCVGLSRLCSLESVIDLLPIYRP